MSEFAAETLTPTLGQTDSMIFCHPNQISVGDPQKSKFPERSLLDPESRRTMLVPFQPAAHFVLALDSALETEISSEQSHQNCMCTLSTPYIIQRVDTIRQGASIDKHEKFRVTYFIQILVGVSVAWHARDSLAEPLPSP